MKIVIIRHAEPDYENNTLTKKGFLEADILGKYYSANDFDYIYSSPLPRAILTAERVVKGVKPITQYDWLVEFYHPFINEDGEKQTNWEFKPSYLNKHPDLVFSKDYLDNPLLKSSEVDKYYEYVIKEFDQLLAKHGYVRDGNFYKVTNSNTDTIVLFCHFGMMSVLLSRLLNIPYTQLAQFTVCLPTGITTLVSEEREKGIAQFRMMTFGDISHLKREGIEPSFRGKFCEIFDSDDRH